MGVKEYVYNKSYFILFHLENFLLAEEHMILFVTEETFKG
jgi:hypothetical protein